MKKLILGLFLSLVFTINLQAQDCPTGQVCIPQATANKLFDAVTQLTAAQEAITKLTASNSAAQTALDRALSLIEKYKEGDVIDGQLLVKAKDLAAASDAIAEMWKKYALDLEARLNRPKSTWDKIAGVLKRVGDILAGVALGAVLR